jgi:hypothetical protein
MLPHLEPIARALDELDDQHYIDFDVRNVPVLILYEQERNRYLKDELGQGLISTNEYRIGTGRKEVESDLADSLLWNPNLTPIANTKKKMEEPAQAGVMGAPGAPGMPPGMPGMPGMPPGAEGMPPDPTTMQGAMELATQGEQMAQTAGMPPIDGAPEQAAMATAPAQASANYSALQTKTEQEWQTKVDTTFSRWTEILDRSLERVFERQQRVVLEKASGVKSRKLLATGALDVESIFSVDIWAKQIDEDIRPVLNAIIQDAQTTYSEKNLIKMPLKKEDIVAHVNSQIARIKSVNEETAQEINNAVFATLGVLGEEDKATTLRTALVGTFTNLLAKKKSQIAEDETRRAWSMGSNI